APITLEQAGPLIESLLDGGYGAGVVGEQVDSGDAIVDGPQMVLHALQSFRPGRHFASVETLEYLQGVAEALGAEAKAMQGLVARIRSRGCIAGLEKVFR